jgi:hypothetical protein
VTAKCLSFIGEFVNHVVQETRSTSYNSTDINDFLDNNHRAQTGVVNYS